MQKGFTLLEIIIVIIIIGVLTSLALPKLFSTIEYSRSAEAFAAFATIRRDVESRILMNNGKIQTYFLSEATTQYLEKAPNSHFVGSAYAGFMPTPTTIGYIVHLRRNTRDGGDGTSVIGLYNCGTEIHYCGTGVWKNLNKVPCPTGPGSLNPGSCGIF